MAHCDSNRAVVADEKRRVRQPNLRRQQTAIQRRVGMISSPEWQKGWGTAKPGRSPRKGRRLSTFLGGSRVMNGLCCCCCRPDGRLVGFKAEISFQNHVSVPPCPTPMNVGPGTLPNRIPARAGEMSAGGGQRPMEEKTEAPFQQQAAEFGCDDDWPVRLSL